MRQWRIIEHTNEHYNKISLETKEGKQWVNAKDSGELRFFLNARWITNLEYLEGLELLKDLKSK